MPSAESILFKIFIAVVIVGAIVILVLVVPRFLPSPATITPSTTVLDSGQTAAIEVGWKGGAAPYTVNLYSSTSGTCSTSSKVVGTEPRQPQPQFIFSVMPLVNTRYCGTVSSPTGSSTISSSVLITVYPALGVPTLSLSNSLIDSGQTGVVTATVGITGGSPPYTVTLYSGTSGTCSSDTTVVKTTSGSNPIASLAGTTAVFTFATPTANTYYCAGVLNSTPSSASMMSAASEFIINPALAVSVSPAVPKLDAGQSITLTALASGGTPAYSYQWYSGFTCSTPITGQTTSTLSTGTLTTTSTYSVKAGDSSFGTPAAAPCAGVTVTVSSAFTGTTVSIGPSTLLDKGQTASLTVAWGKVGTLPYSVKLTTSSSSACSSPTPTTMVMANLSTPTAAFQVSPSSTIYYCATVTDGATSPESASTTTAVLITVNPALSASIVLSTSAIDTGQTITLVVTGTPSGGTPPYTVTLRGGSSATCSSDPVVGVLTGPGYTMSMPAPSSSTYYCTQVTDSAPTPSTATSTTAHFLVNPDLSVTISPTTPSMVTGKSITLTATPSGGTPPYVYQWYSGTTCSSADKLTGKTAQAYSTPLLNATGSYSYSVRVTDSSPGTPASISSVCADTTVTVTEALVATFVFTPQGIDTGQSTTVTATVTVGGGTPPYTVAIHSGISATCASDTTVVTVSIGSNPQTGVTKSPVTFTFVSPKSSTYYCAVVTDSESTPATVSTSTLPFTVNPALSTPVLAITPMTILDVGQSSTLTATVTWSGGTSPYNVTLRSGSSTTCSSDTKVVAVSLGSNPQTGVTESPATLTFTSPKSNTYYCASVTDTGSPHLTALSTASLFTLNPALSVSTPTLSATVLDVGQSSTLTATVAWTGGTSPYAVTLLSGSSTSCASDTTVVAVSPGSNPQTGVTGSPATFTFVSPPSSTYYCASVSDSSPIEATTLSSTSLFTRNAALLVALSVAPAAIDTGQSTTITATITWSGGTAPFSAKVFEGLSSTCASDTSSAGTAKTGLLVDSTTITFTSPGSSTYYCAEVTDSSSTPNSITTPTTLFMVNSPPTVSISPPAPSIGSGETAPTLNATAALGTPPYTYKWYTGSSCATVINGETSSTYSPGVISVTSVYSVKVTDSSPGTPASISSACASVTVTTGLGPEGVASNPVTGMVYVVDPGSAQVSVIDSYSNTIVKTIAVGSLPWGVAVDSATNVIYVTNYGSDTVSVIDGNTNLVTATITVGTSPEGVAANSALDEAYVANSGSNTVSVIDTSTNAVIDTVPVGSAPQSVAVGPSPYTVSVTDYGSDTVSVITVTLSPGPTFGVTTTTVGSNPWGVAVSQLTDDVYVTNSGSGTVSVLSGVTFDTVATITVGGTPQGIDVDGATSTAYVADFASNTVSAIDMVTNTVITSSSPAIPIPVGSGPWGISVLLNPGNVLYPNMGYVTDSLTDTVTAINLATNQVLTTIVAIPSVSATISPAAPSIDSGQSVTLTALPSLGTPPYSYQWYSGSSCASGDAISGQKAVSYTTPSLTSGASYSVIVTDSSGTPESVCASDTVAINPALAAVISPSSPSIDSGQSVTLTALPSLGTPPYSYQWYSGSSCASGDAISGQTSSAYAPSPASTTSYSAKVTDSSPGTPTESVCAGATITVNPALTAPVISVLLSSISSGGNTTLSTTNSFSGGTSPYTCQWLVEAPGGSFTDLGSSFTCTTSSLPSSSTGTLSTVGTWEFKLEVTDSSAVPNTSVISNVVNVTVS